MQTVVLYSTSSCRYCSRTRSFLDEHGVEYTEHDISKDDARAREMVERTGQRGVPVIAIGTGEDAETIIGYSKDRLQDELL